MPRSKAKSRERAEAKARAEAEYRAEKITVCFDLMAEGESLRSACRRLGLQPPTVRLWCKEEPFAAHYARAKEFSCDAVFDQIPELVEQCHRDIREHPDEANAIVQAYRLQIDAIKWRLSKMLPKKYGDRLDLTTEEKPLGTTIIHVFGQDFVL